MKRLLLPAVISALMIAEVHAESFTISDIRVNGLQRVSAGSVFGALPLNVGDAVDDSRLVDATRALFRTGFFQDIQLGRENDVLVVSVVERPSISAIEIEGNKAIKTEDLLSGLQQSGLAEGEIFQRATLEGVRNELQRQYVGQGRYSASIETEVVAQPRNRVALKIKINEGSVAAIKHINVVGNSVFSDEDLADLFELKITNWLSFFRNDDKYAREKLSGDLERLRSYYLDRGYINMDITSTQVSITPDKKNVYVTVNIDEGQRYTLREVKLSGDLKVPEEEIRSLLLAKEGQVFSRKVMTTTSELITRRLGNEGYTFANVNGIPEPHDEDNTVSLTFVVDPGRRAYVNRVNFRGNTKTEDEVLRREMRQMEGGWASTYLIDQSKVRLERLGFFKEVNVETPQVPGSDDQIDVNYTVEEQPSGSIMASIGFAQNAGLILGGSISQNNFLGTGNRVSIGLTRSEYQQRYNFGFVDPYWTEDGVSLGYNAFYRTTDYDKLDYDVSSYSVDSLGAGVNIGYPISETSRLSFGMTVQQDSLDTGRYTVDEILDFMDEEGDRFLNVKASVGWSQSTLNRGVLATRGHSQSLVLESTIPGSDLSFFKLDYNGQLFVPLSQSYTLRMHTQLGYGDSYGSTSRLPFYEHYYAGGFNSVRGFEDSSLGPRSTPSIARDANGNVITDGSIGADGRYTDPDQDPLPFGGNVLVQGGLEVLFPLPFVKDQRSLRTSLFWDVGNVFDTNCPSGSANCRDIDFGDLASSVGVGLTWITAMGPLSFSLAMPVKKPDDADTQVFQFSLGQTF
ncbi:outer membrane protein assembly factor BamA [Stutzerimonas kirkiae]|uniref:Outer membrane protein assembly factor BamA n=1 Tax=Stutzerimonas kirkiae TaxID=2211392 RepID=A0A4V2KCM7_9GAMM|nr:outer membrane protein assembly factor BamA [Stutzerimonas kirkiae]TBU95512.1 outer membrane protein assembly factor BamA [Stutzerimonas kirkiae]TBV02546.1 outer membrane protein assembly factor BamA [Stutzerimonas kirkiae]TBV09213.1 outer membrane protein assembly factor BamA [Stutzerimonas kirkiae]TBV12192.1 outer membrane protein assembly factor BamA [Stutzerimonas kirkiae]